MAIARAGKSAPVRIARTYRGRCGICHLPVVAGQAYDPHWGGTTSCASYLVHYNCYKPTGAPKIGA